MSTHYCLLVYLICALLAGQFLGARAQTNEFKCSKAGTFADPSDCHGFYTCDKNLNAVHGSCTEFGRFDPVDTCVWETCSNPAPATTPHQHFHQLQQELQQLQNQHKPQLRQQAQTHYQPQYQYVLRKRSAAKELDITLIQKIVILTTLVGEILNLSKVLAHPWDISKNRQNNVKLEHVQSLLLLLHAPLLK
ncbi:hypothetical protein L9F63_007442 [Diploptera punctata]|uniref:Chitin-binding type-2 domain-containing protein n=1 Tax=Diploptera punctata TaxID=6984 RepID=A0AAD8E3B3_DIPPU|nr:hypothetical protein L9F63_007442 [Diploptera punctata]